MKKTSVALKKLKQRSVTNQDKLDKLFAPYLEPLQKIVDLPQNVGTLHWRRQTLASELLLLLIRIQGLVTTIEEKNYLVAQDWVNEIKKEMERPEYSQLIKVMTELGEYRRVCKPPSPVTLLQADGREYRGNNFLELLIEASFD